MTMNIIKTSEWKGQQFFSVVVVPLTCYDYFSFLQMIMNLIFLETSGFTQRNSISCIPVIWVV